LNKAELVAALETRLGSRKAAAEALEAMIETIQRAVARGEKVTISGFGSFERTVRSPRVGRNPRTGETVKIKKAVVPRFRPGTAFKGVVADPRSLPRISPRKTGSASRTAASASGGATRRGTSTTKATTRRSATKS
jgi:DNA-binding protein HU-beta